MSSAAKLLIVALPLALLFTAALRFIQHTEREYALWMDFLGASAAHLSKRCKESGAPAACKTASEREAQLAEFRNYRNSIAAWWWPALATALAAWTVTALSLVYVVRGYLRRRRD